MKKIGSIFLLFVLCVAAKAQKNQIIQLLIQDEGLQPIDNAYVIESTKNELIGVSYKGILFIEAEQLPINISVSHISYQKQIAVIEPVNSQVDTLSYTVKLKRKIFELPEVEISAQVNNLAYKREQDNIDDYEFFGDDILLLLQAGKKNKLRLINDQSQTLFDLPIPNRAIELTRDCFDNLHVSYKDSIFQIVFTDSEMYLMEPVHVRKYEQTLKRCEAQLNGGFILGLHSKSGFEAEFYIRPSSKDTILLLQKSSDAIAVSTMKSFKKAYDNLGAINSASAQTEQQLKGVRAIDRAYTYFRYVQSRPLYNPIITINNQYLLFNHYHQLIYYYGENGDGLKYVKMQYANLESWKNQLIKDYYKDEVYGLFKKRTKRYLKKVNYKDGSISEWEYWIKHPFAENLQIRGGMLYYLYKEVGQYNSNYKLYKYKL